MRLKHILFSAVLLLCPLSVYAQTNVPSYFKIYEIPDYVLDKVFNSTKNALITFEDSPAYLQFAQTSLVLDGVDDIITGGTADSTDVWDASAYAHRGLAISFNTPENGLDSLVVEVRAHTANSTAAPLFLARYILTSESRINPAEPDAYKGWVVNLDNLTWMPYLTFVIYNPITGTDMTGTSIDVFGRP